MILLRTLGDCTIEIGETRLAADSEILFSLLAYLIVERGRPIPRSVLLEFFWADQEDSKARHCLRQSIYKLRRIGVPIETRNDRYLLPTLSASIDIDLLSQADVPNGIESYMLCVLPGYDPTTSPSFQEWTERLRERGQHVIRTTLLRSIAAARKRNDWELAGRLAKQCLTIDVLNEEATLTLAEAMALAGDKRAAISLLNGYADEVGSDAHDLRLQASVLRMRICERITYAPAVVQIPLVGRAESMSTLTRIARLVSRAEGRTVVLYGEAGIGKTRLASELVNLAALEGFLIARVCCRLTTRERALALFMDLSTQLLRLPGALGCSPEALGLVRRLCQHDATNDAENQRLDDPIALHTNIRVAVRDLIDAITAERPLIILIEDAHWIDELSLSTLREIAVSNANRPLLLLVTSRLDRIEELTRVLDSTATLSHALHRLTDEAAVKLARHLCGAKSESPGQPIIEWCVTHGSGNPLFITELVNHWHYSRDTDHIPASLEALILQRVAALSPSALRLLQAAALLGSFSTHERLHAILKCPHWEMLSAIEELERSGVATSSSSHLQPRHELIARAAQDSLTPLGMQLLHLAIAESLESHSQELKEAPVMWDAATHWSAGGNKERAIALAIECASHLLRIGLPYDAGELLQKALVFADSDDARLGIYTHRAVALRLTGAWQELLENSEDALAISHTNSKRADVHSQHEIDNYTAHYGRQTVASGNVIRRALACVEDTAATSTHRLSAAVWGLAACYADCQRQNATRFMQQLATIEGQSHTDARNALLCALVYHLEFGELEDAVRAGDALLSAAEESCDPANIAHVLRVSTYPHRFLGDFELVNERIRRCVAIAEEYHLVGCLREALVLTAQHCCSTGDYDRAWTSIQTVESQLSGRRRLLQPSFLQVGAEIALMRRDFAKAAWYLAQLNEYQPDCARFDGDRLALLVMYEAGIGNTPDSGLVENLWRRHEVLRAVGGQEFPTATLCIALSMRGEESRSQQVARDYANRFRRERFPISNRVLLNLLNN